MLILSLLAALVSLAAATFVPCPDGTALAASFPACSNTTNVAVPFSLAKYDALTIVSFEPTLRDIRVNLGPSPNVQVKLIDVTNSRCIVGPGCLYAQACAGVEVPCITYDSVQIIVAGNVWGSSAPRTLELRGAIRWTLAVTAYATADSTGISASYSFLPPILGGCPTLTPQIVCQPCHRFMGCPSHDIAVCPAINGDRVTLTCHQRELVGLSSGVLSSASGQPPLCGCCNLPFNATPVKVGTGLALAMTLGSLSFDLRRAYTLFFSWLNGQRGGICVNGERRPAELVLIEASKRKDHVAAVTRYLMEHEGVELLLAPYGSGLTEYAAAEADSYGALLIAPASSATSVFRGRPQVFGTLPPASKNLGGVFEVLQRVPNAVVSALIEPGSFAASACGVVPALAAQYGLQVGPTKVLTTSSPSAAEIRTAITEILDAQNGVLMGCVRRSSVCNLVLQTLADMNLDPKAVAFTVCVMTGDYSVDQGRFVMGTTAWVPQLELQSLPPAVDHVAGPSWNSSGWARLYEEVYGPRPSTGFVVSYQAASSWAAGVTLVTAIEQADSTEPQRVAAALRTISINTIFGPVAFDANGQNTGLWNVVQYQGMDDEIRFVAPLSFASSSAIVPHPPHAEKQCWLALPTNGVMGYDAAGDCVACPALRNPQIARFNVSVKQRRCLDCALGKAPATSGDEASCLLSCPSGMGLSSGINGSTCQTCPMGTQSTGTSCVPCAAGEYSDQSGRDSCLNCEPGRFSNVSGATTCYNCTVGTAATQSRSTQCRMCSRGTFADVEGTSSCSLCTAGTVATGVSSSSCVTCEPGTYSAWGALSCSLCEKGKYQNQNRQSTCIHGGGLGATFQGIGLTSGINKPRYWTKRIRTNLTWELCVRNPEACLTGDRCSEGSTGLQCGACLPGYAHQRTRGRPSCFKCPPFAMNLAMTILAGVVTVAFVFWLANNIVMSIRRPQDIRMMLVKALIFYCMMADASFAMLGEVALDYLYPKVVTPNDTWDMTALIVYWMTQPFRLLPGFTLVSESSLWSMNCLFQPRAEELAETVGRFAHTDYHNRTLAHEWRRLTQFHHDTELRIVIFWAVWPLLIAGIGYVIGLAHVVRKLRKNADFYNQALSFYEDLLDLGSKRAIRSRTQDAWTAFVREYDSRILGLWWPIAHAEAIRDGRVRFVDWRVFNREAKSVMQCTVIVCQGAALVGSLRPWNCANFGADHGQSFEFANSIMCADLSLPLYQVSIAAHVVWGLLLPLVVWLSLRRATSKSHWNYGLEEHSVLIQGYAFHAWYWEAVVLAMKYFVLVIAHTATSVQVRNVLLLLLAMGYGLLSTLSLPFQGSHNGLAQRVNGLFVLLWIFQAIFTQLAFLVASHEPAGWLVLFCVLFIMCFHLAFVAKIAWHFHHQTLDSFMMGVDVKAWMRSLEEPKSRNVITFFRRSCLNQYIRHISHKPYVCLDNDFNWVTICGNRADSCIIPVIPRGEKTGLPNGKPDLSGAPHTPDEPLTRPGKEQHEQELQRSLQSAVGLVIEVLGMPTFSVSLLEFVMRAGMMFASDHEKQRRQLSFLHRRLNGKKRTRSRKRNKLEEITVTAASKDPMDLLAGEHPDDEVLRTVAKEGEAGKKRNLWQVARVRLQRKAEAESEEIADYKRYCEGVRERETIRRGGEVPQAKGSVVIRKRASAAMNQSMLLLEATTFCEDMCFRLRRWLQRRRMSEVQRKEFDKNVVRSRSVLLSYSDWAGDSGQPVTYEVVEKYRQKIDFMFKPATFSRGVELSALQLGFMDLIAVPPLEMRYWLDEFETRYATNKDIQSHQMKRLGEHVKDAYTQTAPDRQDAVAAEHQREQLAASEKDRFTVNWLPKLGILPGQGSKDKRVTRAGGIGIPVDASTQTTFDSNAAPITLKVYLPMQDAQKRAVLAWAHFVSLAALPDIKVMGPLLHASQTRILKDLMQQVEIAKAKHHAVQRERLAIERMTGSTSDIPADLPVVAGLSLAGHGGGGQPSARSALTAVGAQPSTAAKQPGGRGEAAGVPAPAAKKRSSTARKGKYED